MTLRPTTPRIRALVALVATLGALVAVGPGTAAAQTGGVPPVPESEPYQPLAGPASNPLRGTGMWIWQVPRSNGGSPTAIAARAKRHGITTVIIKAAHGDRYWGQFSRPFVAALKEQGLRVCAYGRLIGRNPAKEAMQAARAARTGAECFVIDAEVEYNGKFRQARTYMTTLRRAVGPAYPVGFTSFPYVSLHRRVPYSVFLGPGGAQYNLPQMYWRAIGGSPQKVFARTYRENKRFGRPIYPLGQVYNRPPLSQISQFKRLAAAYKAPGVSWWSWQSGTDREFRAIAPRR